MLETLIVSLLQQNRLFQQPRHAPARLNVLGQMPVYNGAAIGAAFNGRSNPSAFSMNP